MKQHSSFIKYSMLLAATALAGCGGGGSSQNDEGVTQSEELSAPSLIDLPLQSFLVESQVAPFQFVNEGGRALSACLADALPTGITVEVSEDESTCEISINTENELAETDILVTAVNEDGESTAIASVKVEAATPYITTWKTDNPGTSEDNQITISVSPEFEYNFNVDWGDGSVDEGVSANITHTYDIPGEYQVSITGKFPQPHFPNTNDKNETDSLKLISVDHWGNRFWKSMKRAFFNADNLVINDTSNPDLSQVSDFSEMFRDADNFNSDISTWDVSQGINFFATFAFADLFNQNIGDWDVSSATNMQAMFREAGSFNQDLSAWNFSNVTNMQAMLRDTSSFNQNIGTWNVSNVRNMSDMLLGNTLSVENYDALLVGWSDLTLQEDVLFTAGSVQFSEFGDAARAFIEETFNWTFDDGGFISLANLESESLTFYTNNAVSLNLNNLGGEIDDCSSLDLPEGLVVEARNNTCEISGTPTLAQEATQSIVSATNNLGTADTAIDITVVEETPYITTWKTDNEGESEDNQITLRLNSSLSYDFTVDWGDGTIDENITEDITHTYEIPGTYTVSITGTYPSPFFPRETNVDKTDSLKLISVEQWGQHQWLSMKQAFYNADNLSINDLQNPDLSKVTSTTFMFADNDNFNDAVIGGWDVSNIEDMAAMFFSTKAFNVDIGDWDVSQVRSMRSMFHRAASFNQDIGRWDVSNVTTMSEMFDSASVFNQDIGEWDVSKVTTMNEMFQSASVFNQDIGRWVVSNVTNLRKIFETARAFNQDISEWDVSKVTSLRTAFNGASDFNQDIGDWNVSQVKDMNAVFKNARSFNQDLGDWDVSNATNMKDMFDKALSFDQNLSRWAISKVTSMDNIFRDTNLSTENYDALLLGWSQLDSLQTEVTLNMGDIKFSPESQVAKDRLEIEFAWTIFDGGPTEITETIEVIE